MKYKGERKFYWEIGIKEEWSMFNHRKFVFRIFFLRKCPPIGEMMNFWRNYIGINYESKPWHYGIKT